MPSSIVPEIDADLVAWADNFAFQLPAHAAAIPLDAATVASALADCAFLSYCLGTYVPAKRRELAEAIQYKDLIKDGPATTPAGGIPVAIPMPPAPATVAPGARTRLNALAQFIKKSPGYNPAIGAALGLVRIASTARPDIPTLKLTKSRAGEVTFSWNKSNWSGVKVQSRLAGVEPWADLGTDNYSPYVDPRPLSEPHQPEVREYRVCYLDKDIPTTDWSDVLVVTVQP